jgi:hypothetical protein
MVLLDGFYFHTKSLEILKGRYVKKSKKEEIKTMNFFKKPKPVTQKLIE